MSDEARASIDLDPVPCPSCGGAGGGPIGRAGSAWDDDAYVCPRCEGVGTIVLSDVMLRTERPGIVKTVPPEADVPAPKRKASA